MSSPRRGYDIYIVGLGILSTLQVTRETEQTIRLCRKVFFLHTETEWARKYLENLCCEVVNLESCYSVGVDRLEAYKQMIDLVLEAAQQDPPVCLAQYGNPMVFSTPTQVIRRIGPKLGLNVKVLPAVSSYDTMLVDLGVDPSHGTLTYEVNDMLFRRRTLLPDLHCFIWQVGGVESELFSRPVSRPNRFLRLKDYLLQFYPPEHEVTIITCATTPTVEPKLTRVALAELETKAGQMHGASTLYVPPARVPDKVDEDFLTLLASPEHLEAITEPWPVEADYANPT